MLKDQSAAQHQDARPWEEAPAYCRIHPAVACPGGKSMASMGHGSTAVNQGLVLVSFPYPVHTRHGPPCARRMLRSLRDAEAKSSKDRTPPAYLPGIAGNRVLAHSQSSFHRATRGAHVTGIGEAAISLTRGSCHQSEQVATTELLHSCYLLKLTRNAKCCGSSIPLCSPSTSTP